MARLLPLFLMTAVAVAGCSSEPPQKPIVVKLPAEPKSPPKPPSIPPGQKFKVN